MKPYIEMDFRIFKTFYLQNTKYGVFIMHNNDSDELNHLFLIFIECFGFREHLDKAWYRWFYDNNPSGVCNNYILVDMGKGKYVGAYGFSKTEYVLNGDKFIGGLGVNGMIIKEYRRKGLYSKLMNIALEKENYEKTIAFSFPHGTNISSIKAHYKSGWTAMDKINFYHKKILKLEAKQVDNVKEIDCSKDLGKVDFDSFNIGKKFYFYKSKKWLTWRFIKRPHKKYTMIGYYESDNKISGYMVLGFYHSKNNLSRCQIIDYGIKNAVILKNLLFKAENIALENNADILDSLISYYSNDLNTFLKNQFTKSAEFYELLTFANHNLSGDLKIDALLGDFDAA